MNSETAAGFRDRALKVRGEKNNITVQRNLLHEI